MKYIQSWENYQVPENYKLFSNLAYGTDIDQYIHLSIPRNKKNFPTLIWFHGGGMTEDVIDFDLDFFDGTAAVAAVHYRLAPGAQPPAQYEDTASAIAFVIQNIAQYGGSKDLIFAGGLSAGANMVALTVFNYQRYLTPHGVSPSDLKALLLLSGQMTTHFFVKKQMGYSGSNLRPVIDDYAPLHWVENATMPIMLLAGEFDIPARKYENLFMQDILRALGNEHIETHIIGSETHGSNLVKSDLMLKFIKDQIVLK